MKDGSKRISVSLKFAVVMISFLFIVMLFTQGFLRWTLGLTVFMMIALSVGLKLIGGSSDTKEWVNSPRLDHTLNTRTGDIEKIIEGAAEGKKISQALLEQKVRVLIQRKLEVKKGISRNEFKELLKDQQRLKEVVDDEKIVKFLVDSKSLNDLGGGSDEDVGGERKQLVRKGYDYRKWIEDVLDSVEGYR
ncbi:MAG: hypothetical protein ACQESD_04215 [Thermoplasmatota archaeon]